MYICRFGLDADAIILARTFEPQLQCSAKKVTTGEWRLGPKHIEHAILGLHRT